MSKRVRWAALWSGLGILVTFGLIVFAVDQYEAQLTKINWPLVSLLSVFVFGGVAIYRWNSHEQSYNVLSLVMKNGQPDPYRHLLFFFAGLTAWAIVQMVLDKQWQYLAAVLLPSLGYFVLKPTVDGMSDAFARRPAAAEPTGNVQVNAPNADTVNVPSLDDTGRAKIGKR